MTKELAEQSKQTQMLQTFMRPHFDVGLGFQDRRVCKVATVNIFFKVDSSEKINRNKDAECRSIHRHRRSSLLAQFSR